MTFYVVRDYPTAPVALFSTLKKARAFVKKLKANASPRFDWSLKIKKVRLRLDTNRWQRSWWSQP